MAAKAILELELFLEEQRASLCRDGRFGILSWQVMLRSLPSCSVNSAGTGDSGALSSHCTRPALIFGPLSRHLNNCTTALTSVLSRGRAVQPWPHPSSEERPVLVETGVHLSSSTSCGQWISKSEHFFLHLCGKNILKRIVLPFPSCEARKWVKREYNLWRVTVEQMCLPLGYRALGDRVKLHMLTFWSPGFAPLTWSLIHHKSLNSLTQPASFSLSSCKAPPHPEFQPRCTKDASPWAWLTVCFLPASVCFPWCLPWACLPPAVPGTLTAGRNALLFTLCIIGDVTFPVFLLGSPPLQAYNHVTCFGK